MIAAAALSCSLGWTRIGVSLDMGLGLQWVSDWAALAFGGCGGVPTNAIAPRRRAMRQGHIHCEWLLRLLVSGNQPVENHSRQELSLLGRNTEY
jgi:hypothetical protein